MKKLLMKLLGIESASEQLARLEHNQAVAKDSIVRAERTLAKLKAMRENQNDDYFIGMMLDDHIDIINTRLSSARAKYAVDQQLIDIIRATIEAEKGNYA